MIFFLQDKILRLNELNVLRKQIEREYLEKVELEDEIMEKMRIQFTMDKAFQYIKKLTIKQRDLIKSLVSIVCCCRMLQKYCDVQFLQRRFLFISYFFRKYKQLRQKILFLEIFQKFLMFKFVLSGQGRLWINWMKRQFRRTRLLVVVSRRQLRGMLLLRGNRILLISIIKGWRFLLVKLGYEWIFFFFL